MTTLTEYGLRDALVDYEGDEIEIITTGMSVSVKGRIAVVEADYVCLIEKGGRCNLLPFAHIVAVRFR